MRLAFIDFSDRFVCPLVLPADKLKFQTLPPMPAAKRLTELSGTSEDFRLRSAKLPRYLPTYGRGRQR